jgi:hypothetical protein
MLYPFWGNPRTPARDPIFGDFARYIALGPTFFELTPLDAADVAVLPFDWEATCGNQAACDAAWALARAAAAAGKPLVVFFFSDLDSPVPLPATVMRASISRTSHGAREFAMPLWNEDIVEWFCGGRLPLRARPATPVVGFCGRVPSRNPIRTALAGMMRRPIWRGTRGLRAATIDALRRSPRVEARITERGPYFGDLTTNTRAADQARAGRCRREFVDHLIGSDYALCLRGVGHNYSHRVAEALCCGRIPAALRVGSRLAIVRRLDRLTRAGPHRGSCGRFQRRALRRRVHRAAARGAAPLGRPPESGRVLPALSSPLRARRARHRMMACQG